MKNSGRYSVEKSWGYEDVVHNETYCGKVLHINKGEHTSWHYHNIKDECMLCVGGTAVMFYSEDDDLETAKSVKLVPNDSFHIPIGLRHRIYALENLTLVEFSTHHEDSDSIRIQQ